MKLATFWTYTDTDIQTLNIYASNENHNYKRFNDKFHKTQRDNLIHRIKTLKCYDV